MAATGRRSGTWSTCPDGKPAIREDRHESLDPLLPVGRASLSAAYVTDGDPAHGHRNLLIAFGGFTVADGLPTASARVEALPVANA
jgi:hypothetical protein